MAAEPRRVHLALAHTGGGAEKAVPFAAHPDLLRVLIAKQALNLLRLALVDGSRR